MHETYYLGLKALIENARGEYLLLKFNPAMLKNPAEDRWDLPGGRIEKNETLQVALSREVREETALTVIGHKLIGMFLTDIRITADSDEKGLIFGIYRCEVDKKDNLRLSEEHVEHGWYKKDVAVKLLSVNYPKEFIKLLK